MYIAVSVYCACIQALRCCGVLEMLKGASTSYMVQKTSVQYDDV